MKKGFSCVFPISVLALAANAAWADCPSPFLENAETHECYINMPNTRPPDINITADDIANGFTTFKVYDNEDKEGSVNTDLWINIPSGYKFQVTGNVKNSGGTFLIIDGMIGEFIYKLYSSGEYDIGTNIAYGSLGFRFIASDRHEKFDITVSIVETPVYFEYPESDPDYLYAYINGDYQGAEAISISGMINVDKVVFNRTFSTSGYSTLMLPFCTSGGHLKNAESVIEFDGMTTNDKGELAVGMKYVWCSPEHEASLKAAAEAAGKGDDYEHCWSDIVLYTGNMTAYTPYMVQMKGTELGFDVGATFEETPATAEVSSGDGWTFKAALQKKVFTKDDTKDGKIWGFAGEERNGATIGKFVRFGKGAYVQPFRAYLESSSPQLVSASPNAQFAARPAIGETASLPDNIDVVIVSRGNDGDKHTTTIGKLNTRTGEFQMLRDYDLKGRKTNITNRAQGAYYGKKVLKK